MLTPMHQMLKCRCIAGMIRRTVLAASLLLSACAHGGRPATSPVPKPGVTQGAPFDVVMAFARSMLARAPMLTNRSAGMLSDEEFILAATVALHSLDSDLEQVLAEIFGDDIADTTTAVDALEEIIALGGRVGIATGSTPRNSANGEILCAANVRVEYQRYLDHIHKRGPARTAFCGRSVTLTPPALYWFAARAADGAILTEYVVDCLSGCTIYF